MNKIEYFNKEYSYIKDNKKREDLKLLVNELPDYFLIFLLPVLVNTIQILLRVSMDLLNILKWQLDLLKSF